MASPENLTALIAEYPHLVQGDTFDYLPGWDDRKTLSDLFQDNGGTLSDLSSETYRALIAVAEFGYVQRILEGH